MASPRGHQLWADEVEEEEAEERMAKGEYPGRGGDWHPGLDVQRGRAAQRLDLNHGFVRHIVRCFMPAYTSDHTLMSSRALLASVSSWVITGGPAPLIAHRYVTHRTRV